MKQVIISGSSSGIGKAITLRLLDLKYEVIGLARDHQKFVIDNSNYHPYGIDFTDIKQTEQILKTIYQNYSNIEIVIGNAGFGQFGCLEQFSTTQITDLFNVNLISQVLLVKTFLPNLKKRKQGKIILMGSEAAFSGAKQGSIYCASKFALRGFAQSLRQECRTAGVGVTLINPGFVNTPFFKDLSFSPGNAAENALQATDIAQTVAHLLTLENRFLIEEINIQPLNPVLNR